MQIDFNGIVIIAGNYGSGKTETAVNLAAHQKEQGKSVNIADLDLVNPYFRAREARNPLKEMGINVILPDKKYMYADLPILSPAVAGAIIAPGDLTILDAGGDDVGVTVLAALNDSLAQKDVQMLQVVNIYRPFTENLEGCLKIKNEIESSSKLRITGLISNANMIDETRIENIFEGYRLINEVSKATGLPVNFITAPAALVEKLDAAKFDCPILPINRKLIPPWKIL